MRIIYPANLAEELRVSPPDVQLWAYNAFDVVTPLEISAVIERKLSPNQRAVYDFERNLCGPAISMMLNGTQVDPGYLAATTIELKQRAAKLRRYVDQLANAVWGKPLLVSSPDQMKEFFYHDPDGFQCKLKYAGRGKKRTVSCNRKALEKLAMESYYAKPIISAICDLKDTTKELEFLERGVESDGKVHCTFNVAATESGRWSSSHNPWRRGGNFQNQSEIIRRIYIAEPGYVFAYPDLAQAEAFGVAYYAADEDYIAAAKSGDLHTGVAKLVFPELNWHDEGTADHHTLDRRLAETPFYRQLTYRDLAKRGAHGSNYGGMAPTLAGELGVPVDRAEEFQYRYFKRFTGIRRWHHSVQVELQSSRSLRTALGRERLFLGRADARETLKEALAWLPQSLISDILKIGMLRIWRKYELHRGLVKLHADMHDGILLSIKESYLDEIAPDLINLMTVPVQFPCGVMTIPVDFTVGYQWQKKKMPKWKPGVLSTITKPSVSSLLDIEAELIEKV